MSRHHGESHRMHRIGWLRAAVLGANDGIISTASLILGVAASQASHENILIAGAASLVAGAMSMAAGEYVSVHSQADTERADLAREQLELDTDGAAEHRELTAIYINRGLQPELAQEVARQMMAHDALAAHARDELGIVLNTTAQPLQAAWTSATSFAAGGILPLLVMLASPPDMLIVTVAVSSLLGLILLGGLAARTGGAPIANGAFRVGFWGVLAMVSTSLIGWAFGTVL
jgi:VIT1/CCC1 family predicted Fe2+/Mn2+ transporter